MSLEQRGILRIHGAFCKSKLQRIFIALFNKNFLCKMYIFSHLRGTNIYEGTSCSFYSARPYLLILVLIPSILGAPSSKKLPRKCADEFHAAKIENLRDNIESGSWKVAEEKSVYGKDGEEPV